MAPSYTAVVRQDTWAALLETHPELAVPSHRRLFAWTLFGDHVHRNESEHGVDYERVAIPAGRLAEIEGKGREHAQKRYVGRDILSSFRDIFPDFLYTGYFRDDHYRQVDHDGLDDPILDLLTLDLLRPVADLGPAIDLWPGRAVASPYSGRGAVLRSESADRAAEVAAERRSGAMCDEQGMLLDVLNETPSNDLSRLVRHNASAALEAAATVTPKPGIETRLRYGPREMMRARLVQYGPFALYAPSPHRLTVRVHPVVYPAVVSLRRPVREAMLGGCLAFDLKNCQLACAAAAWHVAPLLDLLAREGTAWNHLLGIVRDHHRLTEAEAKRALKQVVYATVFGMGLQGVRLLLGRALSFWAASAFMNDPVIEALFECRDRALAEIDAAGGARDVFGIWYPIRPWLDREGECRSALAALMQAEELRLLLPVVEDAARTAALERPQYRLVAWLHDGFYVKARTDPDGVIRRLQNAVQRETDRLGIPTGLDVERL